MSNTHGITGTGPQGPLSAARLDALTQRITDANARPLVLVGMMGVGKSTIGRKLASLLHLPFADADDEIVKAAKMPIAEIFDTFGEAYFRNGERRVIARMLESGPCIIATGGGAFVQDDTAALSLENGIPIWLDSDVDTLVERVGRNSKRPLLRGGNVREIVTRMKTEREPAYARAQIKVMSDAGPHNATVNRILEALEACL